MLFLKPQHLLNPRITHRRLKLPHSPRKARPGTNTLQKRLRRRQIRNRIVRRIKNLKPQAGFLQTQVTHAAQVPGVDVRPPMHLPLLRLMHVAVEEALGVLVRLDDAADAQDVDVDAEPTGVPAGDALAAQLRDGVGVCWVDVEGFVDGEGREVDVALGVGRAVDRDAAGEDDLLDAQFAGGFDHVVCRDGVCAECFVVRDHHVAGVARHVDDCIWEGRKARGEGLAEVELAREGAEDLACLCEVGFDRVHFGDWTGC